MSASPQNAIPTTMNQQLSKQHQQRWANARSTVQKLITTAKDQEAIIMYDGELITPQQIKIDAASISVVDGNTTHMVFNANPSYDEGLYESILEFNTRVRKTFVLVKPLSY